MHLISHCLRYKVGRVFMYTSKKYSGCDIYLHYVHLSRYKVIILSCEVVSLVIEIGQSIG